MITMKINAFRLMIAAVSVCVAICIILASPESSMAVTPNEQLRINALLEAIGRENDLIFIRNGSEHTAQEAVSHLKLKLRRAGNRISTAEEFIDHLATGSSSSKRPYLIRRTGGKPEPAGPFFHRLLLKVAPPPQTPPSRSDRSRTRN